MSVFRSKRPCRYKCHDLALRTGGSSISRRTLYIREREMPTSVAALFGSVGLPIAGPVPWRSPLPDKRAGVYVVALSPTSGATLGYTLEMPPIDPLKVQAWLEAAPNLRLDGRRPTAQALAQRLGEFWLPDEVVLYVGKATSLRQRVGQYYTTRLGQPRPHAGGHWLKTLTTSTLDNLSVYWAPTPDAEPEVVERQMLGCFVASVSDSMRRSLRDPARPFPFATLEYPKGTRKEHGIRGAVLR